MKPDLTTPTLEMLTLHKCAMSSCATQKPVCPKVEMMSQSTEMQRISVAWNSR